MVFAQHIASGISLLPVSQRDSRLPRSDRCPIARPSGRMKRSTSTRPPWLRTWLSASGRPLRWSLPGSVQKRSEWYNAQVQAHPHHMRDHGPDRPVPVLEKYPVRTHGARVPFQETQTVRPNRPGPIGHQVPPPSRTCTEPERNSSCSTRYLVSTHGIIYLARPLISSSGTTEYNITSYPLTGTVYLQP